MASMGKLRSIGATAEAWVVSTGALRCREAIGRLRRRDPQGTESLEKHAGQDASPFMHSAPKGEALGQPGQGQLKLARLHKRIVHFCREGLHQLTSNLTPLSDDRYRSPEHQRHAARPKAGAFDRRHGWSEFRRRLVDKPARHGGQVIVADRWYPSSKTCSECGHVLESLTLAQRN